VERGRLESDCRMKVGVQHLFDMALSRESGQSYDELIYRWPWPSFRKERNALAEYLEVSCNRQRRHSYRAFLSLEGYEEISESVAEAAWQSCPLSRVRVSRRTRKEQPLRRWHMEGLALGV